MNFNLLKDIKINMTLIQDNSVEKNTFYGKMKKEDDINSLYFSQIKNGVEVKNLIKYNDKFLKRKEYSNTGINLFFKEGFFHNMSVNSDMGSFVMYLMTQKYNFWEKNDEMDLIHKIEIKYSLDTNMEFQNQMLNSVIMEVYNYSGVPL